MSDDHISTFDSHAFVVLSEKKPAPAKSGLPFNAQINPGLPGVNSRSRAEVHVTKPMDLNVMQLVHRTVERVIKHGPLFEAAIMDRESQNPKFKFLFDNTVSFPLIKTRSCHSTLTKYSHQNMCIIVGNYSLFYKVTHLRIGLNNLFKCLKMVLGGCHLNYL